MLIALLLTAGAVADEVCAGPLKAHHVRHRLDEIEGVLAGLDGFSARAMLDDLSYQLRCVDHAITDENLGRFAAQEALLSFYEQDDNEFEAWARLMTAIRGESPQWSAGLPVTDRFAMLVAELEANDTARSRGWLVAPKGGAVLLDGRFVPEPVAMVEVPHFLQVADKKGRVLNSMWIDGVAFPDDWLASDGAALSSPKWYEEPIAMASVALVVPATPVEPEVVDIPDVAHAEVIDVPEVVNVPEVVEPDVPTIQEPTAEAEEVVVAQVEASAPAMRFEGPADCPWKGSPRKASATGRLVVVNRKEFPVASADEQREFLRVLRVCGEFRAARRFHRWRDAKKKLSLTAKQHRDSMIRALITDEPKRRRRN